MRVRLLFIYFPLWTSAASLFIVGAEVIKMAVVQDISGRLALKIDAGLFYLFFEERR